MTEQQECCAVWGERGEGAEPPKKSAAFLELLQWEPELQEQDKERLFADFLGVLRYYEATNEPQWFLVLASESILHPLRCYWRKSLVSRRAIWAPPPHEVFGLPKSTGAPTRE